MNKPTEGTEGSTSKGHTRTRAHVMSITYTAFRGVPFDVRAWERTADLRWRLARSATPAGQCEHSLRVSD